jgi:hypothetical protein
MERRLSAPTPTFLTPLRRMSKYPEFRRELRRLFRGPDAGSIDAVRIGVSADACEICKADAAALFTAEADVPRLPHAGCTCRPHGCRCELLEVRAAGA